MDPDKEQVGFGNHEMSLALQEVKETPDQLWVRIGLFADMLRNIQVAMVRGSLTTVALVRGSLTTVVQVAMSSGLHGLLISKTGWLDPLGTEGEGYAGPLEIQEIILDYSARDAMHPWAREGHKDVAGLPPLAVAAILEHRCMVRKIVEAGEILESSLLVVTGTPKPLWLGTTRHFAIEVGNLGSVKDIAMTATRTNIDEVSTGGKPSGKQFPVEKVKPVANMGEATRLELELEKAMWNSPWLLAEILKHIGITK